MKRLFVALCMVAAVASGAYLETGGDSATSDPVRPGPPVPPVIPSSESFLPALAQRVTLGTPMRWSHLTVYPLVLPARHGGMRILTLDQALQRNQLAIREVGEGQVARLAVRNDANLPVFLMAGELILGGKQNRMVRDDVLLGRNSGWREIAVYCGEQHRWRESGGFKSGGTLSAPSLRKMAAGGVAQDRIWGEIRTQLEAAEVTAPTANYQQLFETPERQRRLDACVTHLRPLPGPRTVGCIVISGHRVIGADLFSDPDIFAALWPKLCRSYGADGEMPHPPVTPFRMRYRPAQDGVIAQQFLNAVSRARFSQRSTPGDGVLWALSGSAEGTSLEGLGGVIHAGLFSNGISIQPRPGFHLED